MFVSGKMSAKFTAPVITDPFAVLQYNCSTGNELRWSHVSVRSSPSLTVVTLELWLEVVNLQVD